MFTELEIVLLYYPFPFTLLSEATSYTNLLIRGYYSFLLFYQNVVSNLYTYIHTQLNERISLLSDIFIICERFVFYFVIFKCHIHTYIVSVINKVEN